MMKCPYCHSEIRDDAMFCSECGQKIEKPEVKTTPESSVGSRVSKRQQQQKSSSQKNIIIIGAVVAAVLIAAICYFLFFKSDDSETKTTEKQITSQKTETTKKIKLEKDSITIKVGEHDYIEADVDCTYSVKDESICEVDRFGTVTGLKAGQTTITCKGDNGAKATVKITVEAGGQTETIAGDYVFPNSSTVLLTENDLKGKSEWELRIGINEIYARHHCTFKTEEIVNYFQSKSWYSADPNLTSDKMNADVSAYLNDIEVKNVNFIRNYQQTH